MYYNTEDYSFTFSNLDEIEEKFIDYIVNYINVYPFIWNELTNRILCNQMVNYVKDTTFIITIYEIKNKNLKWFFELFKDLLRIGYVRKIIYRKEFMIVHLYSKFITDALSTPNNWLVLMTYKTIKCMNMGLDLFLNVDFESKLTKEKLGLIICKNNIPIVIINTKVITNINLVAVEKIWLYLFISRNDTIDDKWEKIQFSYDNARYSEKLQAIITNNICQNHTFLK